MTAFVETDSPTTVSHNRRELERPDSLDDEGLRNLLEKIEHGLEAITTQVMTLERNPADARAYERVIAMVGALKACCRTSYLMGLVEFLQSLETFLVWLRSERRRFTFALGEALLLSLDRVKLKILDLKQRDSTDIGALWSIAELFERIALVSADEMGQCLTDIVKLAGGDAAAVIPLANAKGLARPVSAPMPRVGPVSGELARDSDFFRSVAAAIDKRCPYWEERSQTQLDLALGINKLLKSPVNAEQLTAAVYLHDVGMLFLAPDLLNKPQRFDASDEQQLRDHVQWSHQWLRRISGWDEAAVMVLQHHERPDGTGYPAGIGAATLHDGAQIIALADTFFSITHERADRASKKSLLRAIAEINAYREVQFKGHVVDAFNALMRQRYGRQSG